jgi:hypothetical protein
MLIMKASGQRIIFFKPWRSLFKEVPVNNKLLTVMIGHETRNWEILRLAQDMPGPVCLSIPFSLLHSNIH